MAVPREGITIDLVARATRKSLLNPFLITPAAFGVYYASLKQYSLWSWGQRLTMLGPTIYALAVISLGLALTDYLNERANNNCVQSSRYDWNKEIVVVTGGSSGIGASLAQQLRARNHLTTIIIIDYVPLTWAPPDGSRIYFFQCDLSDSSEIRSVCNKIRQDIGHPTILVNNAGISRGSTICDGPYSDVELTIRINLTAPSLLAKEFLPDMVRNDHGHIVNISSMSAFLPPSKVADYAATKAGLIALHEALQLELKYVHEAPRVRLSVAIFSFIRTPLFKGETKQSHFLFPLLHVETVSESIANILYSGYGKTIYMPGTMRYVAVFKGGPEWLWRIIREGTNGLDVDFKGRQKVDPKSGRLLQQS